MTLTRSAAVLTDRLTLTVIDLINRFDSSNFITTIIAQFLEFVKHFSKFFPSEHLIYLSDLTGVFTCVTPLFW